MRSICCLVALLSLIPLVGCGSGTDTTATTATSSPAASSPTASSPGKSSSGAAGTVASTGSPPQPAATAGGPAASAAGAADGSPQAPPTKKITPEEGLKLARDLITKRDYQNALVVLTQVLRAQPDYVDAYLQRANLLAAANRTTLAIEDLTAATKIQSDNAKIFNSRGYLYLQQQQYAEALADFERATSLDTSYAQPINNRGLVRIAQGDIETALKDFEYALKLDPKYFDAYNNRGFALMKGGKTEEAVAAFNEAIGIHPNYVNGLINRGQAYLLLKKYDLAAADFSKLIALQPGNTQFYEYRSLAFRELGRTSEAARDQAHVQWTTTLSRFNRDLARNPNDADAWVARGRHLLLEDKFAEALADFDRALKTRADHAPALLGKAMVWTRQEKHAEAIETCSTLIAKSGDLEAYSLRGDLHFQAKQYDAAIADYEQAHRFDSRVAEAYLARAEVRKGRGEIQQASADIAQAQSMDPKLRPASAQVSVKDDGVAPPLPSRSQR